ASSSPPASPPCSPPSPRSACRPCARRPARPCRCTEMPSTFNHPMPPKVDHRRAIAERNAAGILDALERLGARGAAVNMAAIAAEAGVSRPTLYAHYKTLGAVVEAAAERTVVASRAAFEAARPQDGPADQALERM